ncbi:MAG: DUF2860 domain-containing protein [Desulfobacterales bacterium]|nr:DUF2860 domain-containing protein [Desulfobacterales bacterium]MCP4161058.1 DUF2860 domain-containing protein [Deltaproteobacteria bacterium]
MQYLFRNIILIFFFFIASQNGFAENLLEDDFFNGFSAKFELCTLGIATNSNIIPFTADDYEERKNNNQNISSLTKNSHFVFAGSSDLLFNIEYTFESGTVLYLGTPFYDDARDGVTFGVEKEYDNFISDFAFFANGNEVWKNPYLTNTDRTVTDEFNIGFVYKLIEIYQTGFSTSFKSKYRYIEDDDIGKEEIDLKRDGFIHTIKFDYDHQFNTDDEEPPNNIVYSLTYNHADMEGESNSYYSLLFGLKGTYWYEDISVGLMTNIEGRKYKKSNPIFNIKKDENILTNGVMITFNNLGKSGNWYLRGGFSVVNVFSNIDFYESDSLMCLASIGYNFQ